MEKNMTTIETVKAIRVDHDISLLAAVGYAQAGIDNPLDIESVGCILKRMRNEIAMLELQVQNELREHLQMEKNMTDNLRHARAAVENLRMTNEQLDEARMVEATRRGRFEAFYNASVRAHPAGDPLALGFSHYRELVMTDWTPTDPDLPWRAP